MLQAIFMSSIKKVNKKQFCFSVLPFRFLVLLSFIFTGIFVSAQEKELDPEVVNIVKPYTPSVQDAFKIEEIPEESDMPVSEKKEITYQISSVPVASTFTPAKGKAVGVERAGREKTYDNYARLGAGNYTSILAELYSNFEISNAEHLGFFFRHNSSQGGIKGVRLDDTYYNTSLDASYSITERDASYRIDAGLEHQLFNWYGVPGFYTKEELTGINPKQNYFGGYAGGTVSFKESLFERADLKIRYLGDSFSSSEFQVTVKPKFVFPLESFDLHLDADLDYLTGSFDKSYYDDRGINYGFFNFGLLPSLKISSEDFSLSLGAAGYISVNTRGSKSDFSLYPKIDASYRLDEAIIVYGGVDGGLYQNSYYNFKNENPFVSPTLHIIPTRRIYNAFAGINGSLSKEVSYNLKASYGKDENKALFQSNPASFSFDKKPYEYSNSFGVVYDDIHTLSVFGEVQVGISKDFSLGVNAEYLNYNTDLQEEAWNLPELKASLFSDFSITEEIYGGASVFYTGSRKELDQNGVYGDTKTLKGYIDANLHAGYRFTDQFSVFVRGNNLFGSYKKWMDYPVLGIQVMGGVIYNFDW